MYINIKTEITQDTNIRLASQLINVQLTKTLAKKS